MSASPTLPTPVTALLTTLFPDTPITDPAPTVGGFSNLSLAVRVGGKPCVVKAAELPTKRADLRREAAVLTLLRGRRLGAPELLAHGEGGGWSVLVTRHRRGLPGISLYSARPDLLALACTALGRALRRLHACSIPPPPGPDEVGLILAGRAAALATALGDLPLPDELRGPCAAALAHPAWQPTAPRLIHGDAGLHNILWAPHRLTLLDWEWAGWGDPRLDLAWVAWTLRFRGMPAALWDALLAGYGQVHAAALGLDRPAIAALALGQVTAILARSVGRPTAWDEWVRRARWTVETLA